MPVELFLEEQGVGILDTVQRPELHVRAIWAHVTKDAFQQLDIFSVVAPALEGHALTERGTGEARISGGASAEGFSLSTPPSKTMDAAAMPSQGRRRQNENHAREGKASHSQLSHAE